MTLLLPVKLYAQNNNNYIIGGEYDYNGRPVLKIEVDGSGMWIVYRNVSGTYQRQFYKVYDIFAIKINNTVFHTHTGTYTNYKLTSSDVVAPVNSETVQVEQGTKKYTGTYNSQPFSVDITFRYDKNNPDYFTIIADIDAGKIPSTASISLAYGFDTYVNNNDFSAAITYPDLGYNGSNDPGDKFFTAADVQNLYLVGCINDYGAGSLMALSPMGDRPFSRAYSAFYGDPVNVQPSSYITYTTNPGFFNYDKTVDNGVAVAYDNIRGGAVTTISTGLTFTSDVSAGLTYALQQGVSFTTTPSRHLTVPMNTTQATQATLRLSAKNNRTELITGVAFQVNMSAFPPGLTVTGAQTSRNFTATQSHTDDYYKATNGTIAASATADILVPISAASYGEWTIDYPNISNMLNIMPMGTVPAVFTVTTTAGYASTAPAVVVAGGSKDFTVKLSGSLIAHKDIKVYLTPNGAISSFSTIPEYVTIPDGANSVPLTVIAQSTATPGQSITITLSYTDYDAVLIGTDNRVTLTVEPPKVYYIPVNPHLRSIIVKQ
jgi:hypothetical protein